MVTPLDHIFREEWGRVLATLIGFLGDFDLAEDAAQEAFAVAAQRWPRDGVPSNPRAWLMTTARNRATDSIRRERALAAKAGLLAVGGLIHTAAGKCGRLWPRELRPALYRPKLRLRTRIVVGDVRS